MQFDRTMGTMMVSKSLHPELFIAASQTIYSVFFPKINAIQIQGFSHCEGYFNYFWIYENTVIFQKTLEFFICVYFGGKYTMNCCDTTIESSGCTLFENKNLGTIMVSSVRSIYTNGKHTSISDMFISVL